MAKLKNISLALALFVCASFTILHHGWADYDQTKPTDFNAKIEDLTYENPHVLAKVKYNKEMTTVYLAPVTRMESRGLNAEMVKKGTNIRFVAYPHKTEKNEMRAERIYVGKEKYELR